MFKNVSESVARTFFYQNSCTATERMWRGKLEGFFDGCLDSTYTNTQLMLFIRYGAFCRFEIFVENISSKNTSKDKRGMGRVCEEDEEDFFLFFMSVMFIFLPLKWSKHQDMATTIIRDGMNYWRIPRAKKKERCVAGGAKDGIVSFFFIVNIKSFYNRMKFISSFRFFFAVERFRILNERSPSSPITPFKASFYVVMVLEHHSTRFLWTHNFATLMRLLTCHVMMWSFTQHIIVLTYKLVIIQHIQLFTGTQLFSTYATCEAI